MSRISRITVGLTAAAMLVGATTGTMQPASVAAGAAVMLANFHLLRFLVSLLIRPGSGTREQAWAFALFLLKLTLALLLVAGVLYQFPVEPLAFAVGVTMLLIAVVLEATVVAEPLGSSDRSESESN